MFVVKNIADSSFIGTSIDQSRKFEIYQCLLDQRCLSHYFHQHMLHFLWLRVEELRFRQTELGNHLVGTLPTQDMPKQSTLKIFERFE